MRALLTLHKRCAARSLRTAFINATMPSAAHSTEILVTTRLTARVTLYPGVPCASDTDTSAACVSACTSFVGVATPSNLDNASIVHPQSDHLRLAPSTPSLPAPSTLDSGSLSWKPRFFIESGAIRFLSLRQYNRLILRRETSAHLSIRHCR